MNDDLILNFNPIENKCIHCGKTKGKHKAKTFNCPYNEVKRGFASFKSNQFFTTNERK